jgi:pimeloyl-ACP methyl ester carboxylesterase
MQAELASLEESSLEEKDAKITTLGDIPLTVLAHGYLESRLLDPIGTKNHEEYEAFWRADQAELASLSPQGQLIVAEKSGHYIQFDEPDLVITAIEQVLLKAQA